MLRYNQSNTLSNDNNASMQSLAFHPQRPEINKKCKTDSKAYVTPLGANFTNILEVAFHTKLFCAAFLYLQFVFVLFWQKDFGKKDGRKILVKLTIVVYDIFVVWLFN